MSINPGGGPVTDEQEPVDAAAKLEEMAEKHITPATEAAKKRLVGLARTNSQIHAEPRPGVSASPHGVSISGRAVRRGDVIFRGLATGSGALLLVVMALIAVFLVWKAIPAFTGPNKGNIFTTQSWLFPSDDPADVPTFGVAALFFGTVVSSVIAMIIGVPIAVGIALFIALYAKRRLATMLGGVIDLLAAVPSLVFGMWGLYFLVPSTRGFQSWLSEYFGWLPFLHNRTATEASQFGQSLLIAGVVLAIMIIPTVSAVTREVFLQVPGETMDAAWALGATKWEMVRTAVIPFGRAGMISAAMLGLGRALGETIAVALVLNSGFIINGHITEPGGDTFASTIALKFGDAASNNLGIPALITAGLFLFAITLVVNSIARLVIARKKEFS
ncbi:phosphate transport system permease protein [Nakamurella sp. UYEF19]|uniref:phosphate ABC transporter permease subunit PstC n=1 Tax=Nakamurella sp. UYEF19 TaxID=1756392 RepID=UPI00339A41F5